MNILTRDDNIEKLFEKAAVEEISRVVEPKSASLLVSVVPAIVGFADTLSPAVSSSEANPEKKSVFPSRIKCSVNPPAELSSAEESLPETALRLSVLPTLKFCVSVRELS